MAGWKKFLLWSGIFLLLSVVAYMFIWASARREYKETVADLREKKLLLTLQEIQEKYPPSPPEKLQIWKDAVAELFSADRGLTELKILGLTGKNVVECRIALRDHPELLKKLDALTEVRDLSFPYVWEKNFTLDLSIYNTLSIFARINATRAELAAQDGEWEKCKEYLKRLRATYDITQSDPLSIAVFYFNAKKSIYLDTIQKVIRKGALPHLDSDFLRWIIADAETSEAHFRDNLPDAHITEFSFAEMDLRKSDLSQFLPPRLQKFTWFYAASHHGWRDKTSFIKMYAHLIPNINADVYAAPCRPPLPPQHYYLTHKLQFFYDLKPPLNLFSHPYARFRTLRVALAAELYRRKYGVFPETLEKLIPEFLPAAPIDPFTGKTLLYRNFSEGIIVYSTNQDKIDDAGKPPKHSYDRDGGDIGFFILTNTK